MRIILYLCLLGLGMAMSGCKDKTSKGPITVADSNAGGAATLVGPLNRGNDMFAIEMKDEKNTWLFECTAAQGGRITGFSLNGQQMLTDKSVNATNFGSSFWTSPQSDWNWPPPNAIDVDTFAVEADEKTGAIKLTGAPETEHLNVQIIKTYTPDLVNKAITIEYTIRNTAESATTVAPWEITRVYPGGLTFYPQGEGTPTSNGDFPYNTDGGITWFQHGDGVSGTPKLFSDGADGWVAHTDGKILLVKRYDDQPASAAAPKEAEIELYSCPTYVEVEQQGAYTEIPPNGGELTWKVTWYLRAIPANTEIKPGSTALVDLVKDIVG